MGSKCETLRIEIYAGRIKEHQDKMPRQSDFSFRPLWATVALWDGLMGRLGLSVDGAQTP